MFSFVLCVLVAYPAQFALSFSLEVHPSGTSRVRARFRIASCSCHNLSSIHYHHKWRRHARQVEREYASAPGQIGCVQAAVVRTDSPATECKAETEPRSIGSALLEWPEQRIDLST